MCNQIKFSFIFNFRCGICLTIFLMSALSLWVKKFPLILNNYFIVSTAWRNICLFSSIQLGPMFLGLFANSLDYLIDKLPINFYSI